ncbi:hypothetical protein ACFW9I_36660 [[Kitasatospora] papulosa]|uniref:hypothetical protein n=1 Tax=[Kitasatospora] papulosa TaxID=1464011 RepID=UPI003678F9FF
MTQRARITESEPEPLLVNKASALTTMLAAGGILVLALTGHTDVIPAVAGLGGIGLIGGAAPVTVNIIRNVKQP